MSCQLLIFDLDGTILNTLDDLTNGGNCAMEQCGLRTLDRMTVRNISGTE